MWVYLNVSGNKYEVGTADLYKSKHMWDAFKLLVNAELATYGANMSDDQQEFAFVALIPCIKSVIKTHFNPEDYPYSVQVLQEILDPICQFSERVVDELGDHNYIKTMCSFMMALTAALKGAVPAHVMRHLSDKVRSKEAGIAASPAQAKYVCSVIESYSGD
jgi:hypothetical protein